MQRIIEILPAGSWPETAATEIFAADYEGRHRRRMVICLQSGEKSFLIWNMHVCCGLVMV